MSEQMSMSKAEFEAYLNESFDNGTEAAFKVIEGVIAQMRVLASTTTPPPAPTEDVGGAGVGAEGVGRG